MSAAHILIVDDEPTVLDYAKAVLTRSGHAVLTAAAPRRALEIVRSEPRIDLVLADIVMPGMSGPELLAEIGRIAPATPGILMSGYAPEGTDRAAAFLQKPFAPRALQAIVEDVLARSAEARRGLASARAESSETRRESRALCESAAETVKQAKELIDRLKKNWPPPR